MSIDERARDKAIEYANSQQVKGMNNQQQWVNDFVHTYETAKEQPDELPPVEEIKPCPYVNGFSSNNDGVSFMLKRYPNYSDFILFENGRPSRCFRFDGFAVPLPKRESVNIRALAARLSDAATAVITFTDWGNDGDGVMGRQAAHRQYIAALKEWQEANAALQAALTTQIEGGNTK